MSEELNKYAKNEENKNAYNTRHKNFEILKNGLIKKYIETGLDLLGRQEESILKITDAKKDDYSLSSGYFNACTAFGKTYLIKALAEGYRAEETQKKIIILEETTDILQQVAEDLADNSSFQAKDIGVFYKEEKTPSAPIIVCTYTSMQKMVKEVGKENIGLVLCDEAHHGLSPARQSFIRQTFDNACLYGFTGTPEYNAAKTCKDLFITEIDNVDIKEGVNNGLLCSVKNGLMISKIPVDLTGIKDSTGDYNDKKLMEAINKASHKKGIRESLVDYYLNAQDEDIGLIKGKTTLINVPNKEEAEKLAKLFNKKAKTTIAKAYHEETTKEPLQSFNKGEFPILIQVKKLSEGYNNPKVELCINYPTASQVREAQCSGRALRRDSENPNKLALIIDIVFKKEANGDVYDQIARNGQVLFKDIAENFCFISPDMQKLHDKKSPASPKNKQQKTKISDDMLFDIITSYEDLYTLAIQHEEYTRYNNVPHRKKNDIGLEDLKTKYAIYLSDGTKVKKANFKDFFITLTQNESLRTAGIIARLIDFTGARRDFIVGDKLTELQDKFGITISLKGKIPPSLQKGKDDIGIFDFRVKYNVYSSDGSALKINEKLNLFEQIINDEALLKEGVIVKKAIANGKFYPCIPIARINDFQRLTGYHLRLKEDTSAIEYKAKDDIGSTDYLNIYHIYRANGTELTDTEKAPLFRKFVQNQELINNGIIKDKKTAGGKVCPVIVGTQIKEFQRLTGFIISKTSLTVNKKENDICYEEFVRKHHVYDKSGRLFTIEEKKQLFNDDTLFEQGFTAIKNDSLGRRHKYLIGDKLDELKQQFGYTIKSDKELYTDLMTKASQAQVPAEKNKYLTQAKKIFEKLNPSIKKQNTCTSCFKKIIRNHD